jgi:predicted O-methyltransferase YrrM
MNELLHAIFKNGYFTTLEGHKVIFHSETPKGQCEYIQKLILDNKLNKSIEIGIAHGLSTLAICEAISFNKGKRHVAIDPFENTDWGGHGIQLIKKAGYIGMLDFRESYCFKALAELIINEEEFDFAYIDSVKQFDWILTDFFLLDKLLSINGIIVLDDVSWPGIRKVARFIKRLPHYKVVDHFPENRPSKRKQTLKRLIKFLPKHQSVIRNDLIDTDYELSINCRSVAFQKTSNDERNWDWHKEF